ncbi:MAG: hypothetical protein ACYDBS_09250 [Acidimicrobiales bacterium]
MQNKLKSKLLATTGAAVVLTMAAGGVAYASTGTSTTTTTTSSSAPTRTVPAGLHSKCRHKAPLRWEIRHLLRRTVHADLIVHARQGYQPFLYDRGVSQTDTASSITIKRPDGPIVSAAITSTTRFVGIKQAKLASGDRTIVVQSGGTALLIATRSPSSTSTSGG